MKLTESIFKIHKFFAERTSTQEADTFVRHLVSNTMADLQDKNEFTPENLEMALSKELESIEVAFKTRVA